MLPAQAAAAELILSPANLAPAASRRNIVVIHDAAALRHPEAYSDAFVAYHRRILPLLARRARLVLTPSEFSRQELVEVLGADPDRVVVVPEGVDERFTPDANTDATRRRTARSAIRACRWHGVVPQEPRRARTGLQGAR